MPEPVKLPPVERRATAGVIADVIRDRIIDGTFPPGTQLAEVQLAGQLGVSRGPIREALQRLIQEGLLDGRPHRGVFVTELSDDDVVDVYQARAALEQAAAARVVRRGDPAALTTLERLVDRMASAATRGRWSNVVDLDRRFHEALVDAAGSKRLSRMFATLLAETALCMSRLEPAYPSRDEIVAEHRRLLAALREGDADQVRACIDEHLEQAVSHLTTRTG